MRNNVPVVFFHDGCQEYLKYAICSAEKYNQEVVLLGAECNRGFCKNWFNTEKFDMTNYHEFEKVYVHLSSNSYKFELNCFKRYFMLQEWFKVSKSDYCVLIDSDILTYVNYTDLNCFKNIYASVSMPKEQSEYSWAASPHTFYCTSKSVNDFIEFFIDVYTNHVNILKEKYEWHKRNSFRGGVCDMTLLYLWAKDRDDILNISKLQDIVFDHSIQTTSHYVDNQFTKDKLLRIKKVAFINNMPYFEECSQRSMIPAATLHFQGSSKAIMGDFYYNGSYIVKLVDRYIDYFKRIMRYKNNVYKT